MSMELKGRVIQLLPIQTGMGKKGQWQKQDFILETEGQYPKKVCLSLWGAKIDEYDLVEGLVCTCHVELESREYNSRWYTEARAWKIEWTADARKWTNGGTPGKAGTNAPQGNTRTAWDELNEDKQRKEKTAHERAADDNSELPF